MDDIKVDWDRKKKRIVITCKTDKTFVSVLRDIMDDVEITKRSDALPGLKAKPAGGASVNDDETGGK